MTKQISVSTPAPASGGEYLTDIQLAAILAVEPRTLRLWRNTRGLPHVRVTSRVIRYRKVDIDQWMARRRVAISN
jgi:predicted DNA-binding transcriptional regulator AlpA